MIFSAALFSYPLTFIDVSLLSGQTQQVENDQFQTEPLPVFIYYTPLPVDGLQLDADETTRTYLFVTSIDEKQSRAKQSFDYGKQFFHFTNYHCFSFLQPMNKNPMTY